MTEELKAKICNTCKVEKLIIQDFPKNGRIYRSICKVCHCEKQKQRYIENRDEIRNKMKDHYEKNKETILEKNKDYRKKNRNIICEQKKEYYQKNRNEILEKLKETNYKEKRNKYLQNRRKVDKRFALINAYRARLYEVLHKQKRNTYVSYLNCNREMFLDWIEFQFADKFKWEDYGKKWVIDHVIPIDFFDLENYNHQYKCFSWFNLRPCEIRDNMEKSNKILEDIVKNHQSIVDTFIKIKRYQADIEIYQWLRNELRYGKNPSILGNPQPSS
jgi:hypothetical protein